MPVGRLRVVSGPAANTEIPIGDELVLGRSGAGPGTLGGDPELSRLHARVRRTPEGTFVLEDFGSTNGTFLNGWRVIVPQSLSGGDRIELGGTVLELIDP